MTRATPGANVVMLADDGLGTAEQLAHALESQGWRPVVLGGSSLDLADGAAVCAAVDHVRDDLGPIGAVIHLASLTGGPGPPGRHPPPMAERPPSPGHQPVPPRPGGP